jgi:hypothetical protein
MSGEGGEIAHLSVVRLRFDSLAIAFDFAAICANV